MAVEDALVLADLLTTGRSVAEASSAYERRRHERVAWVQAQTHRRDRTRGLPPPPSWLVLRLAGEHLPLQLRPAPRGSVAQPTIRWLSPNSCQR